MQRKVLIWKNKITNFIPFNFNMAGLKHIIFDLDNTLWDFSGNSKRILGNI
ncbi:MAG: hypothetical protein IPL12_22160 [Bacteroidetes bacterium]|nr:hypothetical protein [Bacteroidota bacterium]